MKIPYSDKTNEELSLIYKDYVVSKNEGIRCESFVPYSKEILFESEEKTWKNY